MLRNRRTLIFMLVMPVILFALIAGPQIRKTVTGPGIGAVGQYTWSASRCTARWPPAPAAVRWSPSSGRWAGAASCG